MSDNISRQKLIEAITAGEYTTGNIFKDMELQQFIKDQPPADQWIPCSERLPKKRKMNYIGQHMKMEVLFSMGIVKNTDLFTTGKLMT
jgi:hypothetical protein